MGFCVGIVPPTFYAPRNVCCVSFTSLFACRYLHITLCSSLVTMEQLPRLLGRMLNEEEFLAPGGLRSLSKEHEKNPLEFTHGAFKATMKYEPAESEANIMG